MIGVFLFMIVIMNLPEGAVSNDMTSYNDNLARKVFFPLASAANGDTPDRCLEDLQIGAMLLKRYEVRCDYQGYTCVAYVAISLEQGTVFLFFRPATTTEQVQVIKDVTATEDLVPIKPGGKINPYFSRAFNLLWATQLQEELYYVLNEYPSFNLYVTGHSLGGSLASIAATFISFNNFKPRDQILLYTFGEPRTGDAEFAQTLETYVPYSYRVTHRADIVPQMSPYPYMHHRKEIWYNNDMASGEPYEVCTQNEDPKCLLSKNSYTWSDHSNYFNVNSRYAVNGCKQRL